jgi:hypothetical protein
MRKQIRVEAHAVHEGDLIPMDGEQPREVGRVIKPNRFHNYAPGAGRVLILDTQGERITRCFADSEINVDREVEE